MAAKFIKVDPFDLVVFGGTGDLAYRKLYPALLHRDRSEQFSEPTQIIGVSRRHLSDDDFRASVREALSKFNGAEGAPPEVVERFLNKSISVRSTPWLRQVGTISRRCSARKSARAPIIWRRGQTCSAR